MSEVLDQRFPWTRFWSPRGSRIQLLDGGYLTDPETDFGRRVNPDLVRLSEVSKIRCLVLLGEPGLGKTSTLELEKAAIESDVQSSGDLIQWIRLEEFGSEDRLYRRLFDGTTFQAWLGGKAQLHLFLDSLDESRLLIRNVASFLAGELCRSEYSVERLWFRIACRTAEWPDLLEKALQKRWSENVGVYELAPLRRKDVAAAAEQSGFSASEFVDAVDRAEAVGFAIRPVTLRLLLKLFRHDRQLPRSKWELYERGCEILADESSETRREARYPRRLTGHGRLIVASRIAAMTMLCNRRGIALGGPGEISDADDLRLSDLVGGFEESDRERVAVGEEDLRELMQSGLFATPDAQCTKWAHQTYAEFLAGRYVKNLPLEQVRPLFTVPDGEAGYRVVPQLTEVAAWAASARADLFNEMIARDPGVLLRGDVSLRTDDERAALVSSLLDAVQSYREFDAWKGFYSHYHKLDHRHLAEQLKAFVSNKAKPLVARRAGVEIAERCNCTALGAILLQIALDESEDPDLRSSAISALRSCGDAAARTALKDWILGDNGANASDSVRGEILRLLWPGTLSASELFSVLLPPQEEHHVGMYQLLLSTLAQNLKRQDLPDALKWCERYAGIAHAAFAVQRLVDAIFLSAWEHVNEPDVSGPFARAALARLRSHYSLVSSAGFDGEGKRLQELVDTDDDPRHALLLSMLPLIDNTYDAPIQFLQTHLVRSADLDWLLTNARAASGIEAEKLAKLVRIAFDQRSPRQFESVWEAAQTCPALAMEVRGFFDAIDLDSAEAAKLRAAHNKEQAMIEDSKKRSEPRPLHPPLSTQISERLDCFNRGDCDAFWTVNRLLAYRPDQTPTLTNISDIRELFGWHYIDPELKRRIIEASAEYLKFADPKTDNWLGTGELHSSIICGYRALLVLKAEAADQFEALDPTVWGRWSPAILCFPAVGDAQDEIQRDLVALAYKHAPDAVIDASLALIDREKNSKAGRISMTLDLLRGCHGEYLWGRLSARLNEPGLKADEAAPILSVLLHAGSKTARQFATSVLSIPLPTEEEKRKLSVIAARELFFTDDSEAWPIIWRALQSDTNFGKTVVEEAAHLAPIHQPALLAHLSEPQLSELFVWLERQFPTEDDPEDDGQGRFLGPRDSVAFLRRAVLQRLASLGTEAACEGIRNIVRAFPGRSEFKFALVNAEEVTRRTVWLPPTPQEVRAIAQNPRSRLARNGDELLALVLESLHRAQEALGGQETPEARFLWDEHSGRPKDESAISDWVKNFLQRDLKDGSVIAAREPEIYKRIGAPRGASTDIHIDVSSQTRDGSREQISIIIEVKGPWNPKLKSAMKTQLVDDYLANSAARHGIYLAAWFPLDQWTDDGDYRKAQVPFDGKDKMISFLEEQTRNLSNVTATVRSFVLDCALPGK